MSLLKELWRGDVPLVKTYWIYGVGVSLLLNVALLALTSMLSSVPAVSLPLFVLGILSILYTLFIAVGIWRSASKYQGNKVWAVLAKIMVVFSILRTVLNVVGVS